MKRLSSKKYRDGSRDQPCRLRIAGVCTGGGETTVFAHIRDRHTGRGIKASDISGADACFACHAVFDGQGSITLSREDWLFYALRGLQETLEARIGAEILIFPHDPEHKPKSKTKAKSASKSRPIPNRPFPKGQKTNWGTRPFPKRNP